MTFRTRSLLGSLALLLLAAAPALGADPLGMLPESASAEADEIDGLIYFVFWITAITFVGVELLLVWFLVKYRARPGVKAKHTHGNHTVELIWTIVPALILVFLALYQMGLWARIKSDVPQDNARAVPVQVFAKQFEWNFRYPGPDGVFATEDDVYTVNQLVAPIGRPLNIELRSMDVLHSFYLPNFRFKNDAVPGVPMRLWLRPNKLSADRQPIPDRDGNLRRIDYWDIVCAELCGVSHTAMAGELYVVGGDQFEAWLAGEESDVDVPQVPVYFDPDGTIDDGNIWSRWPDQDRRNTVPGPPDWINHAPLPWFPEDVTGTSDEDDEEMDF